MKKYEPKSLIQSVYPERLISLSGEHKQNFDKDMSLIGELEPILAKAASGKHSNERCRVVAQSLFDSGFLSKKGSELNLNGLLQCIYGVKIASHLDYFLGAHQYLIDNGCTDHVGNISAHYLYVDEEQNGAWCPSCDNTFDVKAEDNTCPTCIQHEGQKREFLCGDNYASAYIFERNKVVIMEAQEAIWAVVYNNGMKLSLYKLRASRLDSYKVSEFLELIETSQINSFSAGHQWMSGSSDPRFGLVTEVNLKNLEAIPVSDIGSIEVILNYLNVVHTHAVTQF